jgi:hypothetical protein
MLKTLGTNTAFPWCARMLARLKLPPTVHRHGPFRVWQRRFYDLNVWSEKKRLEKLTYRHGNPGERPPLCPLRPVGCPQHRPQPDATRALLGLAWRRC